MRDSLLLEGALSDTAKASIKRVLECVPTNFGHLIRVAGLDPGLHLRHSDLRDVDFTDTDLRGYDFTGSDLRGAHGIRVVWDPDSTVLESAQIDGSIFAHRIILKTVLANDEARALHRRVRGLSWADQIVWAMHNLRPGAAALERDRYVAVSIFQHATDTFLKGEMLKYLERSSIGKDDQLYALMLDIINQHSEDLHLISKTISILHRSKVFDRDRLTGAVSALLQSNNNKIVALAIKYLVSIGSKEDIRRIAEFALTRRAAILRYAFIESLVKRLGPGYEVIARNPVTRDFRDVHESLQANDLLLLVRNIRRNYQMEKGGKLQGPFTRHFGEAIEANSLIEKIDEMFQTLAQFGMRRIRIPSG